MRIDVALEPAEARRWNDHVCIVVDQLRASSMIVRLLEHGAGAVVPAASLAQARRLARALGPGTLLAGEQRVVRPPGFDYGNAPSELAGTDLSGRIVVHATRNGTGVLRSLPADATVLVGCLLNASAVARTAYASARRGGRPLGIVCAGRLGAFALDDAIAAGAIVERVLDAAGADDAVLATVDGRLGAEHDGRASGDELVLTDAARAALRLWRTTPDVAATFRETWSGYLLAGHDLLADLDASLPVDGSDVVPVVDRGDPARIVAGG
jgi:2-phosphosulfolactate phosphatase